MKHSPNAATGEDMKHSPNAATGEDMKHSPKAATGEEMKHSPNAATGDEMKHSPNAVTGEEMKNSPTWIICCWVSLAKGDTPIRSSCAKAPTAQTSAEAPYARSFRSLCSCGSDLSGQLKTSGAI